MTNAWGRDVGIVEYLELTIKMKTGKESVHHREILAAPFCSLHPICDRAVWGSPCHQSSTALAPQAVVAAWIRVVGPTEPWAPIVLQPPRGFPEGISPEGPPSPTGTAPPHHPKAPAPGGAKGVPPNLPVPPSGSTHRPQPREPRDPQISWEKVLGFRKGGEEGAP